MLVFSQYNIQIYCSTLTCLLSIILAIFPSQIRLTKKTKLFFIFLPLLINFIQALYIVVDVYLTGVDNNLNKWSELGLKKFIEQTDVTFFTSHMITASIISMALMFIVISILKKTSFNDKQLMHYYIKLTDEQRDSGHIIIIGGSMDFLGVCPCQNMDSESYACKNIFQNFIEKWFGENKCKKCCLNNEQWIQLSKLINRGCRVQIVCSHPNNTELQKETKALIGFILKTWKKADNVKISFFNPDNDPNLRGRIIEDYNKIRRVCWNFKTSNKKTNSYEMPYIFSEKDRLGALIIDAFEKIQSSGQEITQEEQTEYIRVFQEKTQEKFS